MRLSCPSCEHKTVITTWTAHKFPYGADDPVMLGCMVPVRSCQCGEQWLDHESEDIMQQVVDIHLSLLTN